MLIAFSYPHSAVRPLVLALSLLSISAHAEVTQLEDVVVTATREATPIAKAPVSIGKVNQQTIHVKNNRFNHFLKIQIIKQ